MEVTQSEERFPLINYDLHNFNNRLSLLEPEQKRRHGNLFPNLIRAIITGPSNCGKTNVMLGLILRPNGICFENICLYSNSLNQPKYLFLKTICKGIKNLTYSEFSANDEILAPAEAKPNTVMIFDDIACSPQQSIIRKYFSMGRHNFIDCFYLSQSYSNIPKQLIRDNANLLIVFKIDELNLRHLFNDHVVNLDLSFDRFKEICRECWENEYGFLVIDKESGEGRRYRKGFDGFIRI